MTKEENIKREFVKSEWLKIIDIKTWEDNEMNVLGSAWARTDLMFGIVNLNETNLEFMERYGYRWSRPKSLSGVEHNNHWVKIESEENLPKETDNYWTITELDKIPKQRWFNKFFNEYENEGKVTHYQLIQKPEKPLY